MSLVTSTFRAANSPGDCHWERSTYYFGLSAAMSSTGSADEEFMESWARQNNFSCRNSFQPNDFGCGWGYSALNDLHPGEPDALALGSTMSTALESGAIPPYSWWWVDTLSMNVPEWVYYGSRLARPDFIALAQSQYNNTKFGAGPQVRVLRSIPPSTRTHTRANILMPPPFPRENRSQGCGLRLTGCGTAIPPSSIHHPPCSGRVATRGLLR
jgi:hypothetical protein